LLGELPNTFVWIEFGSVPRESDEMKARSTLNQLLNEASAVGSAAIPQDDDVAAYVME